MSNKEDSTLRTAFPSCSPDGSFGTQKLREVAGVVSREIVKKIGEKGSKRDCQVKSAQVTICATLFMSEWIDVLFI